MLNRTENDDFWIIVDDDKYSNNYNRNFRFDFSFIKWNRIKTVAKGYILDSYEKKVVSPHSLQHYLRLIRHVHNFFDIYAIDCLSLMTNNYAELYVSYINTLLTPNSEPYAIGTKRNMLLVLKHMINWARIYMPAYAPSVEIFTGREFPAPSKKAVKYIPDDVLKQINEALQYEDNAYLKYGIIILQTTGIRISDLMRLKIDCVKKHFLGGYTMEWFEHKTRKQRQPMAIPDICAQAVERLIEYTSNFRMLSSEELKDYLYIHYTQWGGKTANKVARMSEVYFKSLLNGIMCNGELTMRGFVHNHHIVNNNGEIYNLTSHQFRRTLASDMFSKGVNIKVIQEVLGHAYPQTTTIHYAEEKDTDRIRTFKQIGVIGNIDEVDERIIKNPGELQWFHSNKYTKARMCDGYCTKPIVDNEICDRLLKRNKCYSCSRYITTPEYLQYHKDYLKELQSQIQSNVYGEHYAAHIEPTIAILKEIISRLEGISNE